MADKSTSGRTARTTPQRNEQSDAAPSNDATEKQVQEIVDREQEQGFRGIEVDPTPNEAYTLAGQNAGAATPETDDDAAATARQALRTVGEQATGVAKR